VAWLLQIARNAVADRWQSVARERGAASAAPGDEEDPADVDRRAMLAELIGRLPDDEQRVVWERFVEQKSIGEIALELGRTEGAVKQLQFRALESLRAWLRDVHE
jgi:RNA polymerase sigma-70 factor, ECF subfamily